MRRGAPKAAIQLVIVCSSKRAFLLQVFRASVQRASVPGAGKRSPDTLAKKLLDCFRKSFHGEWFCENRHAPLETGSAHHTFLGIAGDEQNLEIWSHRPPEIRELPAVHAHRASLRR